MTCQSCKNDFTLTLEDSGFYEKMKVPPPTWCPECRMIRRFAWRNQRALFRRENSRTGEQIFSGYAPEVKAPIWDLEFWNSDGWDPMEYGKEYDFSRPFFEQFKELLYTVPWPAKSVMNMVNSEYANASSECKNAYLCFDSDFLEDSAYVVDGDTVNNGFDLFQSRHSELCYDCYMVDEVSRIFFSVNVEESTDIWFSRNLVGCQNCIGCANLHNKSYYIFNQPYTKEAYKEKLECMNLGSYQGLSKVRDEAHAFWLKHPMRFTLAIKVVNSTGEHIEHSKNLKECYNVHDAENLAYSQFIKDGASDSYDYTSWGYSSSEMYESVVCGAECSRIRFSWECWPGCSDLEYSALCRSSSNLFGCVGLKKKQYCIFNKQYSKEEYTALREKIIAQMKAMPYIDPLGRSYGYGEFLPVEHSPFAYNETIAQDFFLLAQGSAPEKGFVWREPPKKEYTATIRANDLPDAISETPDTIVNDVIECMDCKKAYRIIEMELQFLKRIGIPLPRKCPDCRFKDRFQFVNPPKFWEGKCHCAGIVDDKGIYTNGVKHFHNEGHCPNEFKTSYALERPDITYCEQCYQAEVA